MPIPPRVRTAPTRAAVQGRLIVARDSVGLGQALQESFAAKGRCTVVVDQRRADRRRCVQPVLEERRRTERRNLPSLAEDLRLWSYVVVRPAYRRPHA